MKSVIASVIAFGSAALLSPAQADTYVFQKAIAVPPSVSNGAGGQFARIDISFFDPATQLDYVALQPRDQNVFFGDSETSCHSAAPATMSSVVVVALPGERRA
jgi:hypothetical protein